MDGKERGREKKAEKKRMGSHWTRQRLAAPFGSPLALHVDAMKALLALLALPLALAASSHRKLVDLATAGSGLITLDATTYDLITAPNRNWSVAIQLTALDPKRRCAPCKEFDSTWKTVAAAWATVPQQYRGDHFFASLDFDHGHTVFQKVKSVSHALSRRLTLG